MRTSRQLRRRRQPGRSGMASLQAIMTLATVFVATVFMLLMAVKACAELYHVIGSMVSSPYM